MITEGLKLALLGMSVVFIFLLILIGVVSVSTNILKPIVEKEKESKKK